MTNEEQWRAHIIATARMWLGTPYRHNASRQGVGADCLGLLRGVYKTLYGAAPQPPSYTPDWGETPDANGQFQEQLLTAAQTYLTEIEKEQARGGDVVLFRLFERGPIKHCAILTSPDTMLHAYSQHEVSEAALNGGWRRHITHGFAFQPLASGQESP